MSDYEETVHSSSFKDMKTGLVVFGILQIIMGGFCALMVPFAIVGMIASAFIDESSDTAMSPTMMIPAVLIYVAAAVWFIWMGIGSIKARRWARALLLVTSWIWLVGGIVGFIFIALFMPDMFEKMEENEQIPAGVALVVKSVMIGFMAVFYVIIPAVLVLFYGNKNVKATCEFRDTKIRWTDKCPLPVLALSLMFGFWAVSMLFMGFYGWVVPFFGFILSGVGGAALGLIVMLISGYIAWGTYRLSVKAWWSAVLLIVGWAVSTGVTFSRVSLLDYYEKMNFPEQQLDAIKQYSITQGNSMLFFWGLWLVGFLGYLLYTRRYFVRSGEQENTSQQLLS
ncbi:MAG: spermidine synthase family protein [Planctomycetota bacterium]|jgi:MFS family permease